MRFLGWQPDAVVRQAVARCRAFLFPGEEEFGIAPLEATAAGRPVVAYGRGALTETVVDGVTGLFFREQTAAALIDALRRCEVTGWSPDKIRAHALRFSEETFRRDMAAFVDAALGGGPGGARRVLKERRLWLVLALAAGDALAGAVALVGAYLLRFQADVIPAPLGIPPFEPYLSLLVLLFPLHALSLRAVGLYEYRHERTKADEAFIVLQGVTLATLLLVAATFFFRAFSYSRWFMLVFWAFDVVAVFGVRLAIRDVVRALRRHGRFVRRALVVGAGELGQEVVRRLRGHPEFGVRVVGYLDDRIPVGERIEGRGGARRAARRSPACSPTTGWTSSSWRCRSRPTTRS